MTEDLLAGDFNVGKSPRDSPLYKTAYVIVYYGIRVIVAYAIAEGITSQNWIAIFIGVLLLLIMTGEINYGKQ